MKILLENNSFISINEKENKKIITLAIKKGDKLIVNSVSLDENKWNEFLLGIEQENKNYE